MGGTNYGIYLALEPMDEEFLAERTFGEDAALYTLDYGCELYSPDTERMDLKGGTEESRVELARLAAHGAHGAHVHCDYNNASAPQMLKIKDTSSGRRNE